jgi:hypothetical protein
MPIRRSSAPEVHTLMKALSSADDVARESAIARLAVIGGRAVDRLAAAYPTAARETRMAILRALEGIGDPRALPVAREALREGGEVAIAAASTLKPLLQSPDSRTATDALDALVSAALNGSADRRVRLAAFAALTDMPETVRAPISAALRTDDSIGALLQDPSLTEATWQDAINGRLPEDPAALRAALTTHAEHAPLGTLQNLVEIVRERETEPADAAGFEGWREVRGAIHQALALRGSRVAAYDLRETFASARGPLPATFLAAMQVVGDQSCLEPIVTAWSAASGAEAEAWRYQLQSAFATIVKREKLSKRSAVLKRIAARWPEFRLL